MNIAYHFDQKLKRIVLTSETNIQGKMSQIQKVLTVNPNLQKVVYQTGWTLNDQDVSHFESHSEMRSFLRDLEKDKGQESLIDGLNELPEIQALIDQHFVPLTRDSLKDFDLSDEVKNSILNILDRTKFLSLNAIVSYIDPNEFTIAINWFMEGQKFLSFSTKANQYGRFDKIYPTKSQNFNFDVEDQEANPEDYFDWLWQDYSDEEVKTSKAACLWMIENMPEFFMIKSENHIFMN